MHIFLTPIEAIKGVSAKQNEIQSQFFCKIKTLKIWSRINNNRRKSAYALEECRVLAINYTGILHLKYILQNYLNDKIATFIFLKNFILAMKLSQYTVWMFYFIKYRKFSKK